MDRRMFGYGGPGGCDSLTAFAESDDQADDPTIPRGRATMTKPKDIPPAWRRVTTIAVGGLTEVGFDATEGYLLVVSWQGRGLIDTRSGRKLARDDEEPVSGARWIDEAARTVAGIGLLEGQAIPCVGLWGGALPERVDGWSMRVRSTDGADNVFLVDERTATSWPLQSTITEVRAAGFSASGQIAVVATSSDIDLYARTS
jgi:hypothetical protein